MNETTSMIRMTRDRWSETRVKTWHLARRLVQRAIIVGGWMACVGALAPASGMAQSLFLYPNQEPDVATYGKFQECLGAVPIISSQEARTLALMRLDTLPPRTVMIQDTIPARLLASIKRCGAKFTAASVFPDGKYPLGTMWGFIQLLLWTGRDAELESLLQRWETTLPTMPARDSLQSVMAQVLAHFAGEARPRRPALIERADALVTNLRQFYAAKADINVQRFMVAMETKDTAMAKRALAFALRFGPLLRDSVFKSDSIFNTKDFQLFVAAPHYSMHMKYQAAVVLDSIGVSDSAYQRLINSTLTAVHARKGWNREFDALTFDWAKASMADTLKGVYWTSPAGVSARPSRGKTSLMVTLGNGTGVTDTRSCPTEMVQKGCVALVPMLRRIQQQFPMVEINLLAGEIGYFGFVREPTTPEEEAALVDSIFKRKYRAPGTLLMYKNPFVRLPEPDGRRINTNPGMQARVCGSANAICVISPEGRIIRMLPHYESRQGRTEQILAEVLTALIKRQTPAGA